MSLGPIAPKDSQEEKWIPYVEVRFILGSCWKMKREGSWEGVGKFWTAGSGFKMGYWEVAWYSIRTPTWRTLDHYEPSYPDTLLVCPSTEEYFNIAKALAQTE